MTVDARGAGGRDAEVGAAERRLAEALRAQASLGARAAPSPPTPPRAGQAAKAPQKPHTTKAAPPKAPAPKGQHPPKNPAPKNPQPSHGKPSAGTAGHAGGSLAHQSGPQHGRGQSGPPHPPPPGASRAVPGGQRGRERPDGQPTQVGAVDPGLAQAPTTQQPSAHAGPPGSGAKLGPRAPGQPASGGGPHGPLGPRNGAATTFAGVDRPGSGAAAMALRLRWALLACLVAGLLLGCLLAVLSVLDPGLLPALG
jgi:hypothetical protein